MRNKLFHDASIKLTALYLLILMLISLLFSLGLYRVSAQEIERGIRLQGPAGQVLRTRDSDLIRELNEERDEAVREAHDRIKSSLLLINISILVGGGLICYYLAKRTLEPIERAHEAQSRFTADASHELRTPITAMRAETELTLTEEKLTIKKARDQLKSNIEELDKLTQLSEGLLQLARLEDQAAETKLVRLEHVINQAVELVQLKADNKSQIITTQDIPNIKIYANQSALIQALVILLDNATKYSPSKTEINITAQAHKHEISISVRDHGQGVKPGDQAHIFERFYRADNARTSGETHGFGIGLAIAQSIVEMHSGRITVKSNTQKGENQGSTFTISLPRS